MFPGVRAGERNVSVLARPLDLTRSAASGRIHFYLHIGLADVGSLRFEFEDFL